ncbi:sarcoplasmic calcium-binding protein-like [Mercenaria mercenaria]|uniref:sarcoplasmic calcium-binding protein-like n=1 Tax=Mercenaria mercenaria TaxID=6596 RepID=UPI00234EC8BF|nr:sarcoplasmic calcium-binding protein-like [Mercenaria mercenaria]
MANEYLIKKWRMWFKALDRKHAGQLTQADEQRDENAYVKLAHLEGERKTEAIKTFHSFWDKFVFHGKSGPVTEEQFIKLTNDDYKANKKAFIEDIRKACDADIKVIDHDGKGFITEEEFITADKSLGLEDEAWNKMYFNSFNPKDGKVPNAVLCDAWADFLVSEDSSKKDVVLDAFEKFPDL